MPFLHPTAEKTVLICGCLLLGILFSPGIMFGQMADEEEVDDFALTVMADSVVYGFFPALGYSSDEGLIIGGLVSRYDYRGGRKPFRNHLKTSAIITTRGLFNFNIRFDQVETFGYPIRTYNDLFTSRRLETPWFGIGNDTAFDRELWDDDYYFYESFSLNYTLRGRYRLFDSSSDRGSYWDLIVSSDTRLMYPRLGDSDNLLNDQDIPNTDGTWVWMVGGGLQWENRDNEFAPTRGNTLIFEILGAPGIIANHRMWYANITATQYFTREILLPLTLALRGSYFHSGGDVPYFVLPELGGENTLRGFAAGRFRDDAILFYNAELRTWLIQYPDYSFRLGGHFFADAGRVFASDRVIPDFFKDHKLAYGFGTAMSVFTDDFILRVDFGFSDELSRIYLGVGYTF